MEREVIYNLSLHLVLPRPEIWGKSGREKEEREREKRERKREKEEREKLTSGDGLDRQACVQLHKSWRQKKKKKKFAAFFSLHLLFFTLLHFLLLWILRKNGLDFKKRSLSALNFHATAKPRQ